MFMFVESSYDYFHTRTISEVHSTIHCFSSTVRSLCTSTASHHVWWRTDLFTCQRFKFLAMPKSRSRRAHTRTPSVRSVIPDPISGHDTGELVRRLLVPVQQDTFCGNDGEDINSWLFHVHAVSNLRSLTPAHLLRHATVALAGRARAKYRVFCLL